VLPEQQVHLKVWCADAAAGFTWEATHWGSAGTNGQPESCPPKSTLYIETNGGRCGNHGWRGLVGPYLVVSGKSHWTHRAEEICLPNMPAFQTHSWRG
jgi:hypothetical protein